MKISGFILIGCSMLLNGFVYADTLPPHPRLLLNEEGITKLKTRVKKPPWSEHWKIIKTIFDARINENIELPPRGGNWAHWYICPKHGVRLNTGKQIGPWKWEHICPVDNEVFKGDSSNAERDFDGVVINKIHIRNAQDVRTAGILYQVTGDNIYAKRARDILVAYTERYRKYPLHNYSAKAVAGGGHVTESTLSESYWLIPLAQGADLVWSTLTDQEQITIANNLFLPAAQEILNSNYKLGIHNIENWKNSAIGLVGFLLDDNLLIHYAIDNPISGYRAQMSRGVQKDGAWFENTWGYLSIHWKESGRSQKLHEIVALICMENR